MTNMRPYRNPLPVEKAVEEIRDYSGSQFDPRLATAFLEIIEQIQKGSEADEKEEMIVARLIKAA
jgi:HD-GYP domain-containing protein (c-di-GMP phosphodiesterase class II)